MTISEALAEGGQTALIGLSTVFSVLIILMIVLFIMKAVFYKKPQAPAAVQTPEAPAASAPEPVKTDTMDDEELVAVITAAIAASLNTSTYNLRIKSLRRIDNNQPAWNRAGIRETINNRF